MSTLITAYSFKLRGDRDTVREAINWCFDNCKDEWWMSMVYAADETCDYATVDLTIETDRDAVLFKTFWADR